jgi:hypothetical protein
VGPIVGAGVVALGGIPALYLACSGLTLLLLPVSMRTARRKQKSVGPNAIAYDPGQGHDNVAAAPHSTPRRLK